MTALLTRRTDGDNGGGGSDDGNDGGNDGGRTSRIPHRGLVLSGAAVVVVAVFATWLVAFSSVFGVGSVAVRGTGELTSAQVRKAADIADGTPLVRLDTDAIRTRVEALPDVASAQISTSFPSTVTITVTERVAVGVVKAGSGYVLVDATGAQFRSVAARPSRLPLFEVPAGTGSRATGGAVATVAAALPPGVRSRIASVQALDPTAITLVLHNGRTIAWGSAARSDAKAQVLPTLLQQPGDHFDVSNPDQPFSR